VFAFIRSRPTDYPRKRRELVVPVDGTAAKVPEMENSWPPGQEFFGAGRSDLSSNQILPVEGWP